MTVKLDRWQSTLPVLTLASLFFVAADARAGCEMDIECKGDRICRDGACVDADEPSQCDKDMDCPADDVCTDGVCAPPGVSEFASTSTEPVPMGALEPAPMTPGPAGDPGVEAYERRSSSLMIAGIVLVPLGAGMGVVGGVLTAIGVDAAERNSSDSALVIPGGILIGLGSLSLIAGATFLGIGAPEVPVDGPTIDTAVNIEPFIGPAGGGVRGTF